MLLLNRDAVCGRSAIRQSSGFILFRRLKIIGTISIVSRSSTVVTDWMIDLIRPFQKHNTDLTLAYNIGILAPDGLANNGMTDAHSRAALLSSRRSRI
ncbi:hypothetical protein CEK25_002417 [Fusarium fujikuroi]|nr:hypothetical protein CEK25_002417 [Fusarium fujikuroi]